jgi:TatD DNase family protein
MKERGLHAPFFYTFAPYFSRAGIHFMKLIDTHTHLYLPEFDNDRENVVKSALHAGVAKMFLPNIDSGTINGMLKMCRDYPGKVYPMMGLHPGSVKENYLEEVSVISEHLSEGGFIAVGETGIDLYWDKTFMKQQFDAFEKQIILALEMNLPIVIHSRNSFTEIFAILDRYAGTGLRGVFHSFTGGISEAEKILEYDFYFGINGIVTFKNSGLDKVMSHIPLNRILLETDSPYLSPVPKRGVRNESSHTVYINEFLAKIYNKSSENFAEITSATAEELFKLP